MAAKIIFLREMTEEERHTLLTHFRDPKANPMPARPELGVFADTIRLRVNLTEDNVEQVITDIRTDSERGEQAVLNTLNFKKITELGADTLCKLLDAIKSHPKLNMIMLDSNILDEQVVDAVMDCLSTLQPAPGKPLTLLVSACEFTAGGFARFNTRLATCDKLANLQLTENRLKEQDILELIDAIQAHPQLRQLWILEQGLTPKCVEAMNNALLQGYSSLSDVKLNQASMTADATCIMEFNQELENQLSDIWMNRSIAAQLMPIRLADASLIELITAQERQKEIDTFLQQYEGQEELAQRLEVARMILEAVSTTGEFPKFGRVTKAARAPAASDANDAENEEADALPTLGFGARG